MNGIWGGVVLAIACGVACGCERTGEAGAPAGRPTTVGAGRQADGAGGAGRTPPIVTAPQTPTTRPATMVPRIQFDPPVLDYGFLKPYEDATATARVRNVGAAPVRILQVRESCKCTSINDLTDTVIPPGGSVDLTARLQGRATAGTRKAQIRIVLEGADQVYTLELRAEVTLSIRITPAILNLAGGGHTGTVVIESMDGRPFNVLAADEKPPVFVGYDPDLDQPRTSYVLEWDLTREAAERRLRRWWVIETDHPDCPLVDAWVRHLTTIERPPRGRAWRVADRRALLGAIKAGRYVDFTVNVRNIGTDEIYAVQSLSAEFDAQLLAFEPNGTDGICTVRVTPRAGVDGFFMGPVQFIAAIHTHDIDVLGKVVP